LFHQIPLILRMQRAAGALFSPVFPGAARWDSLEWSC
jgi:hypothetical protein